MAFELSVFEPLFSAFICVNTPSGVNFVEGFVEIAHIYKQNI